MAFFKFTIELFFFYNCMFLLQSSISAARISPFIFPQGGQTYANTTVDNIELWTAYRDNLPRDIYMTLPTYVPPTRPPYVRPTRPPTRRPRPRSTPRPCEFCLSVCLFVRLFVFFLLFSQSCRGHACLRLSAWKKHKKMCKVYSMQIRALLIFSFEPHIVIWKTVGILALYVCPWCVCVCECVCCREI